MTDRQDVFVDFGAGRRVHCLTAGHGPDVVYFPGNGCSVEDMHTLIPRIAERYRFVGLDGPGRAPTEWPDEEFSFFDNLPPVYDRCLNELGVGRHVAMGHSMGGMYALQHANRHRDTVRALVLYEGFTTLPIHYRLCAPNGMRTRRAAWEVGVEFARRHAANLYWLETHPRFQQSFWLSQHFHDARPWVAGLDVPILMFIGENGQALPSTPDEWRRQLGMDGVRDLTVEVIPNAGHWMMLDDPERVGDALMRFLTRVWPHDY